MLLKWAKIRAAIEGEEAIKKLGDKILPRPNAADTSEQNRARYDAYLGRSVFYNASGRTLRGMAGYVFTKEPVVELPTNIATLEENVDGAGVTLAQQAKAALEMNIGFGRGGLLVDFPTTDGTATTQQDLNTGNISPTICLYPPESIINWRTETVGAKTVLVMLVLRECYTELEADGFTQKDLVQYRVLRVKDGKYTVEIHKRGESGDFKAEATTEPKDKAGQPIKEIPFVFIGATNNDSSVDIPPLLDLVNLNIAHYRNSADHEESCYLVGQPTPWVSGLTDDWVKNTMNGQMHLGSRAVIPLPQGGQAGLLQANANTLPFEAMKHKELQMVALGAKLVEQKQVQQTATEAGINHASEVSVLTSCATNVFLAYKAALTFCGLFVGTETASVEFNLSEPLTRDVITPEQANAITAMWQGGLIDFEEARGVLKKAGIAWKDDKEVRTEVENDGLRPPPPVTGENEPTPGQPKPGDKPTE